MMDLEELKYPIGEVHFPKQITENHITKWIQVLQNFPNQVEDEIKELSKSELTYKYRAEGWNIQQIVNHCIDSHINSVSRFKLTLTEENPTIKPYKEARWAELPDTINYDINDAIILLKSLHKRWVFLLKNMISEDFKRTFIHPEGNEKLTLEENLCIYDWHCRHHLQHIKNAKKLKF
ncbi:MAG: putative metal-dependent hydrolase [Flavobacteriaceae bacterium]|nr:putative metal-dependent hydrolase [Flavobacteriaceae bacterium]